MKKHVAIAVSLLQEIAEAFIWCGGSDDFGPGGKAEKGWKETIAPLRDKLLALVEDVREATMKETCETYRYYDGDTERHAGWYLPGWLCDEWAAWKEEKDEVKKTRKTCAYFGRYGRGTGEVIVHDACYRCRQFPRVLATCEVPCGEWAAREEEDKGAFYREHNAKMEEIRAAFKVLTERFAALWIDADSGGAPSED